MQAKEVIARIQDIYKELLVPLNLQLHMIRTASIGSLICDHWNGKSISKEDIVAAMLLHDIGNIVKYDWKRKELLEDDVLSNLEFWKQHQQKIIKLYGNDDQVVTQKILEPLALDSRIIYLIKEHEPQNYDLIASNTDWELKICGYADIRTGPRGILGLKERYEEIRKRYTGSLNHSKLEEFSISKENAAIQIEQQILSQTDLAAEDINDAAIEEYVVQFQDNKE